ncbi:MAG: hypothetical protein KC456_06035 [Flavobacteriales bacterium]|jgi:periplasmic protein TonB|nr:hypothetical protein [Flavobacteriales bacterium]
MKKQKDDKRKGIIGTIVFHLVLLVIFLFTGLTMPVPIPDDSPMPIQLDLGNTEFGSGDEQPQSTQVPEVVEPISEPVETTPTEAVEELATQEVESAMTTPEKPVEKPVEEKKPELENRLKNALSKLKTNTDNSSQGQGSSDQAGDHGKPDGSPDGSSMNGTAVGGGMALTGFGGRGFRDRPRVKGNWQESGVIVVEVIFDRYGKYVRATSGVRGTTITNAAMIKAVEEAVRKATIDPDPDGPAEKKGEIKFVFSLE